MKTSLPWGGRFALLLLPLGALSFFSTGPRLARLTLARLTMEGISGGVVPSCKSSANRTGTVALYGITFTATGTMSSATSKSLALGGGPGYEFAPMTEFFNSTTGTDWLLFSAIQSSQYNVASSNITSGFPTVFSAVKEGVGTSGIIVDNNASTTTFPQAASIYFNALSQNNNRNNHTNTGNTDGCAVKLIQAGLQQNHA